jgi:hypothetical protein
MVPLSKTQLAQHVCTTYTYEPIFTGCLHLESVVRLSFSKRTITSRSGWQVAMCSEGSTAYITSEDGDPDGFVRPVYVRVYGKCLFHAYTVCTLYVSSTY